MKKTLLTVMLAAGCASQPPQADYYAPQKRGDAANPWGYMDNKVRDGTYFVAATYWDQATVLAMFDRRAGELCGAAGFREFTTARDMMYSVAVSQSAYVPAEKKIQGAKIEGVTREATVTCTKRTG